MGAPIHAKVLLSLHSKGNKAVLGQLHETNHSSKSINGNVVGVEYKISDVGKTLCHLVCRFLEAGQDVQKTLYVGQVKLENTLVNPMTNLTTNPFIFLLPLPLLLLLFHYY